MSQSVFGPVNAAGISGTDYVNTRNAQITAMVSMHSGPNAPSSPVLGMAWLDTSNQTRPVIKVYDGSQWVHWAVLDTSNHRMRSVLDADRDSYVWSPADGVLEFVSESVGAVRLSGAGIGLGSTTPTLAMDLSGKTNALALPVGTTVQAPTASEGRVRFDSTLERLMVANGTAFKSVAYTDDTLPVSDNTIDASKLKGPNGAALGNGNFGDGITMGGDGTFRVGPLPSSVSRGTLRNATNTDVWEWDVPSGVRRIEIALDKVHGYNTIIQLGSTNSWSETGYDNRFEKLGAGISGSETKGFRLEDENALHTGIATLLNVGGNVWVSSSLVFNTSLGPTFMAGRKDLAAALTRIRLKSQSGNFLAGQANILYS